MTDLFDELFEQIFGYDYWLRSNWWVVLGPDFVSTRLETPVPRETEIWPPFWGHSFPLGGDL
jgi:hypothetical protein